MRSSVSILAPRPSSNSHYIKKGLELQPHFIVGLLS